MDVLWLFVVVHLSLFCLVPRLSDAGGSKNTVVGRFSTVGGYNAKATSPLSVGTRHLPSLRILKLLASLVAGAILNMLCLFQGSPRLTLHVSCVARASLASALCPSASATPMVIGTFLRVLLTVLVAAVVVAAVAVAVVVVFGG